MIDVGLVFARFLHFAATMTLAGVSFFPIYAISDSEPAGLTKWRRRMVLATAMAALLGGILWFVFAAANMSGSVGDLADPEVIWSVVRETGFGAVWTARMALAVVIVGIATMRLSSRAVARPDLLTPLLAAALLASLAGTGHSQIEQGWAGVVHVSADAAHLLAAGAWLGGLLPLGFILAGSAAKTRGAGIDVIRMLLRFSGMGYFAVATLIGSGLVNSCFLVGSVHNLLNKPYGQVLLGKLALFAAMVALAAANRFWIVPLMSQTQAAVSGPPAAWTRSLRNHLLGEQFLGLIVLLAVSALGTMHPAAGR
jgi:putative copper resistance protein D